MTAIRSGTIRHESLGTGLLQGQLYKLRAARQCVVRIVKQSTDFACNIDDIMHNAYDCKGTCRCSYCSICSTLFPFDLPCPHGDVHMAQTHVSLYMLNILFTAYASQTCKRSGQGGLLSSGTWVSGCLQCLDMQQTGGAFTFDISQLLIETTAHSQ